MCSACLAPCYSETRLFQVSWHWNVRMILFLCPLRALLLQIFVFLSWLHALSSPQAEVIVDGHVVRSGRNLTVVAVNFRVKESGRVAFLSRATFYNMPVSSLWMIMVARQLRVFIYQVKMWHICCKILSSVKWRAQLRCVVFGLYIMLIKKWMSDSFTDCEIGICYLQENRAENQTK